MNRAVGLVLNRLIYGLAFVFLYQMVVVATTSLLSIPLTGNLQDLLTGVRNIGVEQGYLLVSWWIASTIIITIISILIVRYKRHLSPYKDEADIDIPPRITPVTAIIIGAIISFLFFLLDLAIGSVVEIGTTTDVQAIYIAAVHGDFVPLLVGALFSIIAGFIIVAVVGKTSKVKDIAGDVDIKNLAKITSIISKRNNNDVTTLSDTAGLQPGTLIHVGEQHVEEIRIHLIEYNNKHFAGRDIKAVEDCLNTHDNEFVSWTSITGLHDGGVIKKIGDYYNLHVLTQADIMNTHLRPKLDIQNETIFLILKLPRITEDGKLFMEHISLVFGRNFVLSFQETNNDIFDPIRSRLEESMDRMRLKGPDYLVYALIDAVVDHFYVIMEHVGTQSEILEEELMSNPTSHTLSVIHTMKREMIALRKSIWPLREVIDGLERTDATLIHDETKRYLRDVYGHTVQVMDNIEGLRDMIGSMLDTYMSSVSNKMNEAMKTLTIIASIFIPITFITGIYGTNFSYIPGLEWEGSYFVMLLAMTIITVLMLVWFKKKKWL